MESQNPYAAPIAGNEAPFVSAKPDTLPIASQGRRFANMIVDGILLYILQIGEVLALHVAYDLARSNPGAPLGQDELDMLTITGLIVNLFTMVVYYSLTEWLWQRSLAKFITGTRVVRADGGVPSFGQCVGRSCARFIPFEAFSFFGGKGFPVGWHDSISGTRVIRPE